MHQSTTDEATNTNVDSRKNYRRDTSRERAEQQNDNRRTPSSPSASESNTNDYTSEILSNKKFARRDNPKRNKDFRNYFKEISHSECLINDFSCALQKEILIQGKMFVCKRYVCFYANIFGWVTKTMIPFSEITSIEKKMTALVIPNAILITKKDTKYTFASFLSRDTVYELLTKLWKYSSSSNSSSECEEYDYFDNNQNRLQNSRGYRSDSTLSSSYGSNSSHDSDSNKSYIKAPKNGSMINLSESMANLSMIESTIDLQRSESNESVNLLEEDKPICDCLKDNQHFDNRVLDTKFKGNVEKIYNLLYKNRFTVDFLTNHEKTYEINMGEWAKEGDKLVRQTNYTKRSDKAIGRKCYLKEEVLLQDYDNHVTIVMSKKTPDVSSGRTLTIKTRMCIISSGSDETRVIVTCTSLNAPIEKATLEEQLEYYKALETAMRKYISRDDNSIKQYPTSEKLRYLNKEVSAATRSDLNIKNIMLIASVILILIANIYIRNNIREITKKVESIEQRNMRSKVGEIEFNNLCSLSDWSYALKKRQLSFISDESLRDMYR